MEKNLSLTGKLRVTNMKKMKQYARLLLALVVLFLSITTNVFAQSNTLSGSVIDAVNDEPLIGVSVSIKGTTQGTVTNIDGEFNIEANKGDVLVFSFVGYNTEEVTIEDQTILSVLLVADLVGLDEVVVIGYGTQKKKLNTGATINVKGEDIQKMNTSGAMDALKGISPGVSITQNNGIPGSGSKVLIRGAGTIGDASPLYVVDGVVVGDIDFLSPSDIASIDILKDAASAAIYGSQAANGVILVTTHKGSVKKKPTITYDFYHGWSSIYKAPETLNAQQYIEILNEAYDNDGLDQPDYANDIPRYDEIEAGTYAGTDWVGEFTNENAHTTSHSVSVAGGGESAIYSLGFSHYEEEGILGLSKNSVYKRINVRLNTEFSLIEHNGRDILKIGENINFSNTKNPNIRTGNIYWNDFRSVLQTSPTLPYSSPGTLFRNGVYDPSNGPDPAYPFHYSTPWNAFETNPLAMMNLQENKNSNNNIVGNVYAELEPVKNLKIRSSYGFNGWFGASRDWVPVYDLGSITSHPRDQVTQRSHLGYSWTLTNTVSYNYNIGSEHKFVFLLGQELKKNTMSLSIEGHNEASTFESWERAYLNNVPLIDATYTTLNGMDNYGWGMESYFGRVSYDFRESLLATFILRADGSSMFPEGNQWGYFPSASLGYILSNLDAFSSISGLNYMKIRGSWGQNGNQNIKPFQYLSTITYRTEDPDETSWYFFGTDKSVYQVGSWPARVPNPDITWETSEQTSIGLDVHFLNNRLQTNFDVYRKVTKDWLVLAPQLGIHGTNPSYINGGDVENQGGELALRWSDNVGEFSYGANASLGYNKNEVLRIDNAEGIIYGEASVLSQGTAVISRVEEGFPIGYFWGYETNGIIQNDVEAAAWVGPSGQPYFDDVRLGDVRFVNTNGDTAISEEDKVMLGDPNPDFIFGFQFNAEYKGFYVLLAANGAAGHQVAKSYRGFNDGVKQNYTTDIYDRWHGEGTSNTWPRMSATPNRNTSEISDIYIYDADYLRISNLTVGYDINRLWSTSPLQELLIYFTAKNLHTFTKYPGMDPEVGYSPQDWGSGVDLGLYPASKTYMVGLSVKF